MYAALPVMVGRNRGSSGPTARSSRVLIGSCWLLFAISPVRAAHAQRLVDRLRVRAMVGGGLMVSRDQSGRMGYDTFGLLTGAQVGYALLPWLDAEVGFLGAGFPGAAQQTGGLLTPMIGASAGTLGDAMRAYVQLDAGPGYSGALLRPFFRAGIGIEFRLTAPFSLGPMLGYGDLFQPDAPGNSTDARFVSLGVTLAFRPGALRSNEPAPPKTRWRTVVLQAPPGRVVHEPPPPREAPEPVAPSPELLELIDRAVPKPQLELLAPVLFEFDSDELEPIGVAMLHEVARELTKRTDIELLEIQGYADSRGSDAYNDALSARRADRVLQWLVEHGIDRARLQVAAKGASAPVETGEDEPEQAQNRRVVFRVLRMKQGEQK